MGTFLHRLIGAALLDADTYEEVEADHNANLQALAVVVLASLAAGFGASRGRDDSPVSFFFGTTFLSLVAWVTWAMVMYMVGTLILPTRETRTDMGELLRTLGFAAAPGLLQVFAAVPGATTSVFALCILWTLAATVVAVRQALDFTSTARALAVCGLGWLLSVVIAVLLGLAFGPNLLGAWQLYAGALR
jgi:Yip1-like protein